jgi:hypothetical protein
MRIEPTFPVNRADRVQLGRPATMRDPSRAPVDVVVRNLSETGALLDAGVGVDLAVGTLVSLGVAGTGMHMARVVRDAASGVAVEFMLPLDPRAVAVAGRAETVVSVAIPQIQVRPATNSVIDVWNDKQEEAAERVVSASSIGVTRQNVGLALVIAFGLLILLYLAS